MDMSAETQQNYQKNDLSYLKLWITSEMGPLSPY